MPTRYYFSSTAAAPVASPAAALPSGVSAAAAMLTKGLVTTKDSSALANGYGNITSGGGANQKMALLRYLYTLPATDFTGRTLKAALRMQSANTSGDALDNNIFGALSVRILSSDGATVKGTVYAWTRDDVALAPPAATAVQRMVANAGSACAAVQALAGDLLEVIVGVEATAAPPSNRLMYGYVTGTGGDLLEVDSNIGSNSCPWIEFGDPAAGNSPPSDSIDQGATATVGVGGTLTLTATTSDPDGDPVTVTWSSSDPSIATVDPSTGVVTGVAAGSCTISATPNDGTVSGPADTLALTVTASSVALAASDAKFVRSPYNWRLSGTSILSIYAGAYVRVAFTGTSLTAQCSATNGTPFRVSVDNKPWSEVLITTGVLALASGLTNGAHTVVLQAKHMFGLESWTEASSGHITIDTFTTDGSFTQATARSRRAIVYGDSITEGLHAGPSNTNDATLGYPFLLAEALDTEVGVAAKGGQGWYIAPGDASGFPNFANAWNLFSSGNARDFSTEPDFVIIAQGTNDNGAADVNVGPNITNSLTAMRASMPTAAILVMIPFGGFKRTLITSKVQALQPSDPHLYLVDLGTRLEPALNSSTSGAATYLTADGLHPDQYGHAVLGAVLAERIEAVLRVRELGGAGTITGTLNLQGGGTAASGTMYAARVDAEAIVAQASVAADGSFTLRGLIAGQTYRVWGESVQGGVPWTAQPLLVAAA